MRAPIARPAALPARLALIAYRSLQVVICLEALWFALQYGVWATDAWPYVMWWEKGWDMRGWWLIIGVLALAHGAIVVDSERVRRAYPLRGWAMIILATLCSGWLIWKGAL